MVEQTDLDVLNGARNVVAYSGKKSSLVEWTLSDEWTDRSRFEGSDQPRGLVNRAGLLVTCTEAAGEISAYTRDHVDAFAGGV